MIGQLLADMHQQLGPRRLQRLQLHDRVGIFAALDPHHIAITGIPGDARRMAVLPVGTHRQGQTVIDPGRLIAASPGQRGLGQAGSRFDPGRGKVCATEVRTAEIGIDNLGTLEIRAGQVGIAEVEIIAIDLGEIRPAQFGPPEHRVIHLGAQEIHLPQPGIGKDRAVQLRADEGDEHHVGVGEIGVREVRRGKIHTFDVRMAQIGIIQGRSGEGHAREPRADHFDVREVGRVKAAFHDGDTRQFTAGKGRAFEIGADEDGTGQVFVGEVTILAIAANGQTPPGMVITPCPGRRRGQHAKRDRREKNVFAYPHDPTGYGTGRSNST